MSNHITIELCAEDRARIDRLTKALEALQPPTVHMDLDAITKTGTYRVEQAAPAESPAEPAGAAEAETPATPQPEAEQAATAEPAPAAEAKPAPTTQELQQKVIALVNKGKKADVSAIVKSYAATVSGIPEDKRAECLDKLIALEG
jgi:hypothetical protein